MQPRRSTWEQVSDDGVHLMGRGLSGRHSNLEGSVAETDHVGFRVYLAERKQGGVCNPEQRGTALVAVSPPMVTGKEGLLSLGFRGFASMQGLVDRGLPLDPALRNCGVYAVVTPPRYEPGFIPPESARARGNVLRPWPVKRLRGKWVAGVETVCIGGRAPDAEDVGKPFDGVDSLRFGQD